MKALKKRKISNKISEQLTTQKTRQKITELSYNSEALTTKLKFEVDQIRQELGYHRKITEEDIKTINKVYKWYKKNKR